MLKGSKLGAFLRRHRKAEAELAESAGIAIGWRIAGRVLGAGIAAAAIAAPAMIDLSNNNGGGAAVAISAPGVQAVEAKATEGLSFRDSFYPGFRASASSAHRPFGGYLFLHPYLGGAAQADYFLAWARPRPGDLEPVVDSEMGSPYSAARSTYAALHELELRGYRPLLYASSSYVSALVSADHRIARFRVWQAEYGPTLHRVPGTTVVAWQFTDRAIVKGHALDGSRLLVGVKSLEIPRPVAPKPAPRPTPKPAPKPTPGRKAPAVLKAERGYWPWLEWYMGEGDWRGYVRQAKAVRPNVPRVIPARWWKAERAFLKARS